MDKQDQEWKILLRILLRFASATMMLAGLGYGFYEYDRITNLAESSVHEVYAVSQGMMWAIFGYIAARAFDHIAEAVLDFVRLADSSTIKAKVDSLVDSPEE